MSEQPPEGSLTPSYVPLAEAFRRFHRGDNLPRRPLERTASAELEATLSSLARRWDWRERISFNVRNQGSWNACNSYASVAMIEARRSLSNRAQRRLVPGYIHNCALGIYDPDAVSSETAVLDVCRDRGVATGSNDGLPVPTAVCNSADLIRIAGWSWFFNEDIFRELVSGGPLVVWMNIGESFLRSGGTGVYELPAGEDIRLHAVLLIGYDQTAGWALILNSAGPDWGDRGVGRVRIGSGGLLTRYAGAAATV